MADDMRKIRAVYDAAYSKARIQKRMIIAFAVIVFIFAGLAFRVGWIQIVSTDIYASKAAENQTKDRIIPAKRGAILDRNMKELAVSTETYKIFIRMKPVKGDPTPEDKREEQINEAVVLLSENLGMKKKKIKKFIKTENSRACIARNVSKEKWDAINKIIKEKELNVIEEEQITSRSYPLGSLAAQVLGSLNSEGKGQGGVEMQYNEYLSGVTGRQILRTDGHGNPLPSGEKKTFNKRDGYSVVLTIDEAIQYYVEEILKRKYKELEPEKIECVVMDPKNGEILAMASYPSFDPNDPLKPVSEEEKAEFAKLSDKKKGEYLSKLWRNPLVSDLYEPGSVFKLITASSAIEEGKASPDTPLYCGGEIHLQERDIHCHIYPSAHGAQTLTQAVGNSCNPAMVQAIQKMGYDEFNQYIGLYGMKDRTGIDLPAEASPLTQDKMTAGKVGLATMAFGMGLNVTPIEMISAISAIGNNGKYMKPHVLKALADEQGNIVSEYDSEVMRQVISEQTADDTKEIMTFVTEKAGGQVMQVPGYNIGSKTGTAQKLIGGEYSEHRIVGSAVAMAPMEAPEFVVLVIVDDPKDGGFGGTTAGPAVHDITEELLRYFNIQADYSPAELEKMRKSMVSLPDFKGMSASEATSIILSEGLKYKIQGTGKSNDFKIKDQYPKPGESIKKGGTVYIYAK